MSRLTDPLRRGARCVADLRHLFPLTPLGLLVAGFAAWLGLGYGPERVDRVVHAAGLVALGVVALTMGLVAVATLRVMLALRRQTGRSELHLETGAEAETGLLLPTLGAWPLVQMRVLWEEPSEVEVTLRRRFGVARERVRPLRRGELRRVVRRVEVSDIFGFARLAPKIRRNVSVRIEPPAARLTAHVLSRLLAGDRLSWPTPVAEGDYIEMRRYAHGDPLRHVLWKVFARTRRLMVRTPEQAIDPRPSAAAYLVAGPGDEPAASAARFFVESGLLGDDFLFSADGATAPAETSAGALDVIVGSAAASARGGAGLAGFLERLERDRLSAFVLFVPQLPGAWLERVEAAARQIPGARVVTALDARPAGGEIGRLRRWLFAVERDESAGRRGLQEVTSRLGARGLDVMVLHRPSGELLTKTQLMALAEPRRARA